jgi:hypothetical protein
VVGALGGLAGRGTPHRRTSTGPGRARRRAARSPRSPAAGREGAGDVRHALCSWHGCAGMDVDVDVDVDVLAWMCDMRCAAGAAAHWVKGGGCGSRELRERGPRGLACELMAANHTKPPSPSASPPAVPLPKPGPLPAAAPVALLPLVPAPCPASPPAWPPPPVTAAAPPAASQARPPGPSVEACRRQGRVGSRNCERTPPGGSGQASGLSSGGLAHSVRTAWAGAAA